MIDMSSVSHVRERISDIENRFGVRNRHNRNRRREQPSFDDKLEKEVERQDKAAQMRVSRTTAPTATSAVQRAAVSTLPMSDPTLTGLIQQAATKYHVDPRLVSAVAEVESNGHQSAVSEAGAVGVMQLMPDTAADLGVNPYDERQNIEGGAKYLRQLLDTFSGDVRKAVAAYNAGPQAVKDYGGVPPYSETRDYVNKVLDIYR